MKSNLLKPFVILFRHHRLFCPAPVPTGLSPGAHSSLNPAAPLASQTVPTGANIVIPGAPQFSVSGEPAIAFDGTNFLLTFNTEKHVYAMRIPQAGVILDLPAITVTVGISAYVYVPSVVFDGTNYLMVWIASAEDRIFACRSVRRPHLPFWSGALPRCRPAYHRRLAQLVAGQSQPGVGWRPAPGYLGQGRIWRAAFASILIPRI